MRERGAAGKYCGCSLVFSKVSSPHSLWIKSEVIHLTSLVTPASCSLTFSAKLIPTLANPLRFPLFSKDCPEFWSDLRGEAGQVDPMQIRRDAQAASPLNGANPLQLCWTAPVSAPLLTLGYIFHDQACVLFELGLVLGIVLPSSYLINRSPLRTWIIYYNHGKNKILLVKTTSSSPTLVSYMILGTSFNFFKPQFHHP